MRTLIIEEGEDESEQNEIDCKEDGAEKICLFPLFDRQSLNGIDLVLQIEFLRLVLHQ